MPGSVANEIQGRAGAEIERNERVLVAVQVFKRNEAVQVKLGQLIVAAIEGLQRSQPANIQKGQSEFVTIQRRDIAGRLWVGRPGTGPKGNCFRWRDVLGQTGPADEQFADGILHGKISGRGGDKTPVFLGGTIGQLDGWG